MNNITYLAWLGVNDCAHTIHVKEPLYVPPKYGHKYRSMEVTVDFLA